VLSSVPGTPPAPPSRRAFLALGTLTITGTGLFALTGCGASGPAAAAATTSADTALEEAAVQQAVTSVQALHTGAANLASGTLPSGATLRIPGATARLLTRMTEVHAAQLTQLGSPTAEASPSASPTPSASTEIASPGALATAEWTAARTTLRDAAGLTPDFALLLYRIAASCAANADLLRAANHSKALGTLTPAGSNGTTPTSPTEATTTPTVAPSDETQTPESPKSSSQKLTTDETAALNRLLAGEHAAFYAYPLVIAHIDTARKAIAEALWEAHRQQRDELERVLIAAGAEPAEASAAYEVTTPETSAKAVALATLVEKRLAGLAVDVIAVADTATVQSLAAGVLVDSTRRQAAWSNRPVTEPGN
jgi:hypothetical protein